MKSRIFLLAAVAGAGIGMLTLINRPDGAAAGTVVVTARTAPPEQAPPLPVSAPVRVSLDAIPPAEQAVAEQPSNAPANYTYWEGGDPGVWGTPAEFSPAR